MTNRRNPRGMTTAQFAKLHEINKRTLHYYDEIGLFSPLRKGENGYRYYDPSQSVDFEYIRMLKELNMTIEEIEAYRKVPTPDNFLTLANVKEQELEKEIQKLKDMQTIMRKKRDQILFCKTLQDQEIRIEECESERILVYSFDFSENEIPNLFFRLKELWGIEQIRMGFGSLLSLDNAYNMDFSKYQGIYTTALESASPSDCLQRPAGRYLCGYQKGTWDQLPCLYKNMLEYARLNNLELTGYAYETGLNDFVISDAKDYITKIMIQIQ